MNDDISSDPFNTKSLLISTSLIDIRTQISASSFKINRVQFDTVYSIKTAFTIRGENFLKNGQSRQKHPKKFKTYAVVDFLII